MPLKPHSPERSTSPSPRGASTSSTGSSRKLRSGVGNTRLLREAIDILFALYCCGTPTEDAGRALDVACAAARFLSGETVLSNPIRRAHAAIAGAPAAREK